MNVSVEFFDAVNDDGKRSTASGDQRIAITSEVRDTSRPAPDGVGEGTFQAGPFLSQSLDQGSKRDVQGLNVSEKRAVTICPDSMRLINTMDEFFLKCF